MAMTMTRSEPEIPAQAEATKNFSGPKNFLNEKTISERKSFSGGSGE